MFIDPPYTPMRHLAGEGIDLQEIMLVHPGVVTSVMVD